MFVFKGMTMKHLLLIAISLALTACGTVKGTTGGFFEGAADDMKTVGGWIKR